MRRGGRRRPRTAASDAVRKVDYHNLRNPFPQMKVFSDDRIAAIHDASLTVLRDLGIKVLLPEAREIFRKAGARVVGEMVYINRDLVDASLLTAPRSFRCKAGTRAKDLNMEPGALFFQPGAGAPHATDLKRGRRPGTGQDFREFVQITQAFDVLHMIPPVVEPQDIPMNLRHYFMMDAQLTLANKLPFVFSRGTPQVMESFEMIRDFRGLSDVDFAADSHCYTIINTNSPRTLDVPMAQGLIDFARHGQVSIVTPFTLMGAMAPITVAGALTLSHAEALASIALTQLTNPGAPVCYGTFTSNVDMKSGAPAFGTPEHFKASLAAGQLARLVDLPWRCAAGSAANVNDAQAANETQFGLWGCLMAGATVVIHSAGWLEGGLTVSFEKMITDLEVLQMVAEMCAETSADDAEIALDALAEVAPSGHFFGATHTMERYQTAFYEPLVGDWSNFGTWTERGSQNANDRATAIWQRILEEDQRPDLDTERVGALQDYIALRTEAGGANPES
ncbi:trimethylamine--corrinoid protein Co-methyltransferase [Shimia isoporae]|uniref:Methyltransferase n=1 Tax=Shimia isoporae TaxID=647720 RepID=A0A4R1N7C1_9RHOB|nr:trimethylamine methyltransferase family protein [Shimia isoporae]TCK98959.1 trimethylamine--corrinoid protein Co-methyltransferase [Shimia isoporae]